MFALGGRTRLFILVFYAGLCSLTCDSVNAAPWETLPPDHWAYTEIEWLQTAGYLGSLNPANLPYTRGQVATAIQADPEPEVGMAVERFQLLLREFTAELTSADGWSTEVGGRFFGGLDVVHGSSSRETGYAVLSAGVGNRRMGAFTALRADHDLTFNEAYQGKVWQDFAGFTEAAYFTVTGEKQRWLLKLGRDHVYWGPGEDHLLLNHSARGLDQISFRVRWEWGEFSALIGQVSDFTDSTDQRTNRFISGHRLDIIPFDWLRLGISETLLFTGGIRFGSLNPLLPYYGELVNENSEGNGLIGFDFVADPKPGWRLYGQLLIDDIQFEKKSSRDLEPAEWGWLVGGRWADLKGFLGVNLSYSGITNRSYNALDPRYRYLNYGLPLGSELGNDGDRLRLDVAFWPWAALRLEGFWEFRRQGEGDLMAPFDTTYMNYTVDEGYSEPFPTGIVERTHTLGLGFSWLQGGFLQMEGWIGHDWMSNIGHIAGEEDGGFRGRLSLNVRLDRSVL
ncbi:hypothetical protein CEE37_01020 [candidate division LCP-89 bacterium B3_LCP]|uniref:Capsule assembly Wzi family protein n=1 Tax=candidate division LCP-89 bacterium B3_LCP TaxID=2012998 RepID=A0A532V520_UNCL8|nr:MAG: hypothetical protein CEE37_01020 [candidate division LCP-89 bacterium B3_LCP]